MPSAHNTNAFLNSFMRGFSFVDDINQRNRTQAKLDERLKKEDAERARQVARQEERDEQIREDRQFTQGERQRVKNERELGQAAERELLKPVGERDENIILDGANFSTRTMDELLKTKSREEVVGALQRRQAASPSAPTQTTGLNGAVTGDTGAPGEPAAPGTTGSLLAPSAGRNALQDVDIDETAPFDPEAPQGTFLQRLPGDTVENIEGAGNRVTGGLRGALEGAVNLSARGVNAAFGTDIPVVGSGVDAASELLGDVNLPEEYTTEAEFAALGDNPIEFEKARQRNEQIMTDVVEAGRFELGDPEADRLDALQSGSRALRRKAIQQEEIVVNRYEGFNDPTQDNKLRELTAENPLAGATIYARDRATLQSGNPGLAQSMDEQMKPAFRQAEQTAIETLQDHVQGSPEYAKASRDLRSLRVTQGQMYDDYSISRAAGIDDRGLPVGNAQLSNEMINAANNPDRPLNVQPFSGTQIRAAATTTSRVAGNRRATPRQLNDALILKDAGLASDADIITLNMTGKWPDSSPAAKVHTGKPGDVIWTEAPDGSINYVGTLPGGPNDGRLGRDGKKLPAVSTNQLSQANLKEFEDGFRTMFPEGGSNDEMFRAARVALMGASDTIQETIDLTDPIAVTKLGQTYAGAMMIANQEDSRLVPNWNWLPGESPSFQEILASPTMAARLSLEHDIPLTIEPLIRMEQVNVNNLRQELQIPGKYPADLERAAQTMDDAAFVRSVARYDAIIEQAKARIAANQGQ